MERFYEMALNATFRSKYRDSVPDSQMPPAPESRMLFSPEGRNFFSSFFFERRHYVLTKNKVAKVPGVTGEKILNCCI